MGGSMKKLTAFYKSNKIMTVALLVLAAAIVITMLLWTWKVLLGVLGLGVGTTISTTLLNRVRQDQEVVAEVKEEVEVAIEEKEVAIVDLEDQLADQKEDWRLRDKARIAAAVKAFEEGRTDWDSTEGEG